MKIETALRWAFEGQILDYEHLFSLYYPAKDGTGFTERNQTCAFVSNLLRHLGQEQDVKPFVWYEAPLSDKKSHIDAVVFAPAQETVIFIEAKRLYNSRKKASLVADAKRLLNYNNREYILYGNEDKKYKGCVINQYVVCLADVWLEVPWKKQIPFWWTEKSQLSGFDDLSNSNNLSSSFLSGVRDEGWVGANQIVHRFNGSGNDAWKSGYCLLMGFSSVAV